MSRLKPVLFYLLLFHALYAIPSSQYHNDSPLTYTVDGENDCSTTGTECTSLSQSVEAINAHALTTDDTQPVSILTISITDTTERPIIANRSLLLSALPSVSVNITKDTTDTSVFLTVGAPDSPLALTVTVTGFSFHLLSTYVAPVTGHIFAANPLSPFTNTLILKSVSFITAHDDRSQAWFTTSLVAIATGILHLETVTFQGISLTNEAPVTVRGGSLYTRHNCLFSSITQVANPAELGEQAASMASAGISLVLVTGSVFSLLSTTFDTCSTTMYGGAINCIMQGVADVSIGGMHYNELVIFRNCHAGGAGGALFLYQLVNNQITCNRIEYPGCTAGQAAPCMYYRSHGPYDLLYYITMLDELLRGQKPSLYDFIAELYLATDAAETKVFPMVWMSQFFCSQLTVGPIASENCVTQLIIPVEQMPFQDPGAYPGQAGMCPTLAKALSMTDTTNLAMLNKISLQPNSNLQPTNFSGAAHLTATIAGNGETVTLSLTNLLESPLLTVGPGVGLQSKPLDRYIMVTITDLTFNLQRTEAICLRQPLFKVDNHWVCYNDARTQMVGYRVSTSIHYLELYDVNIISGNEYDVTIDAIAPAASSASLIVADEGTYIILKSVTFSNIKMLTSADLTTRAPLVDVPTSTFITINCKFNNITSQNAPLFHINTAEAFFGMELHYTESEVTIHTVNIFSNVIREEGDGAVISVDLSSSSRSNAADARVTLTNAYFLNTKSLKGNGGAVSITGLTNASQLSCDDLFFSGCSAVSGNNIYIATDSVPATEIASVLDSLNVPGIMPQDFELKTGVADETPLFDSANAAVIILDVNRGNDSGTSSGACGSSHTIPCKTLYVAYNNKNSATTDIIMAPGAYSEDIRPISFITSITISSAASSNSFVTKDVKSITGGVFVVSSEMSNQAVTFQKVTFQLVSEVLRDGCTGLTESRLSSPVISCESFATVTTLDHVAFVLKELSNTTHLRHAEINSPILYACNGSIVLYHTTFSSFSIASGYSLIQDEAGVSLSMTLSTFSDIILATRPLFTISGDPSEFTLLMESEQVNEFRNIQRLSGSGSVLALTLTSSTGLHLANAKFVNCTSTGNDATWTAEGEVPPSNTYAGAIYLTVEEYGGTFTLADTVTFTLEESPDTYTNDDGDSIPYFDSSFNAPWKGAITFATTDAALLWTTSTSTDRSGIAPGSYASVITAADSAWSGDHETMYYVYILDSEGSLSCNNTLAYAMSNHGSSSGQSIVSYRSAYITVSGADVPGCGFNTDWAMPCYSISQAFLNLNPSSNADTLTLQTGTHDTSTIKNAILNKPVKISGIVTRGQYKTFVEHQTPAFTTNSPNEGEPIIFNNLDITTISGEFITNIGQGGITLEQMKIHGIPKATPTQRPTTTFISSQLGTLTLKSSTFSTVTLSNCTFITITGGPTVIDNCTFTDVKGHSPGTGGTCITHDLTTQSYLTVQDTIFKGCHTQTNGAALSVSVVSSGSLTISTVGHPVVFQDCTAVGDGGAIYIAARQKLDEFNTPEVTFIGAFDGATTAYARHGVYIFYHSLNRLADIVYDDVRANVEVYDIDYGNFEANLTNETSIKNFFELHTVVVIDNTENSTEKISCGTVREPCKTYSAAYQSGYFASSEVFKFASNDFPAATATMKIEDKLLNFIGKSDGDRITRINVTSIADVPDTSLYSHNDDPTYETSLILVSGLSSRLYITALQFLIVPDSAGYLRNTFIDMDKGKLEVDTVSFSPYDKNQPLVLLSHLFNCDMAYSVTLRAATFTDFILEDKCLINPALKVDPDNPDSTGFHITLLTTLYNITRNNGDGAVFEAELIPGGKLQYTNINMSHCQAKNGKGGAIALIYEGGDVLIGAPTTYDGSIIDPTILDSCSAVDGGAVYINLLKAPSSDETFELRNLDVTGKFEATRGRVLFAEGLNESIWNIPLWQNLILPDRVDGDYQFHITDTNLPDGTQTDFNMYDLVPPVIYVATSGDPHDPTDEPNVCKICPAIRYALASHSKAARDVFLYPGDRHAAFFTMLDHTVTITGSSASVSVSQYNESFIDGHNNRHQYPIYFLCTGRGVQGELNSFDIFLNKSFPEFKAARCTDQPCEHLTLFQVEEQAHLTINTMRIFKNVKDPPEEPYSHELVNALDGYLSIIDTTFDTIALLSCGLFEVSTEANHFNMSGGNLFNHITIVEKDPDEPYTKGSIMNITLSEYKGIEITNANFTDCYSAAGCLIYIEMKDEPAEGTLIFKDLNFSGILSTTESGQSYFLLQTSLSDWVDDHGTVWTSLINYYPYPPHTFKFSFSSMDEEVNTHSHIQFFDLLDYCYSRYYVSPTGTSEDCGKTTQCPYLHYAADFANAANVEMAYIYLAPGTYDNDNMKGSFLRTMTISGTVDDLGIETYFAVTKEGTGSLALIGVGVSDERSGDSIVTFANISFTIKSTVDSPIYVSVFGVVSQSSKIARLILDTVTFTISDNLQPHEKHAPLRTSLIHATSGHLTLINTTFTNIILHQKPLLAVNPKTVTLSGGETVINETSDFVLEGDNRFQNITNKDGNGAVFSLTLSSNAAALFSHSTFHSCNALLGGAIYVEVPQNVTDANIDFDAASLNFEYEGTITDGTYLYIRSYDSRFKGSTYTQKYADLIRNQPDVKHNFVVHYHEGTTETVYQMYEGFTDQLIVSTDSEFQDLESALEAFFQDSTRKRIFIKSDISTQPPSDTFNRSLFLSGVKSDRTKTYFPITNLPDGAILYKIVHSGGTTTEITCNECAFEISSNGNDIVAGSIFGVMEDDCSVVVSSTTVTTKNDCNPLTHPIVYAEAGTVGMNDLSVYNLVLYNTSLFQLPYDLDFVTIFTTCTFTNITRQVGNGCIFSETVDAQDTLFLRNLKFVNCVCQNGYGGAVALSLRFRSGLQVESVSFINCSSGLKTSQSSRSNDESSGKGGGLYLSFLGLPTTLTFSDVTLSDCSASEGNAIYFDATQLTSTALNASDYWRSLLEGVSGAKEGDLLLLAASDASSSVDLLPYTLQTITENTSQSQAKEEEKGLKTWAIILIVVLSVVVVVVLVLLLICCRRKS